MISFPYRTPALQVVQPLGTFHVAVLPADLLLQVASSDIVAAHLNSDGIGYSLTGTQRVVQDKRLNQIADYIDRVDAAFPNAIILAANIDRDTGLDQDETEAIADEEAAGSSQISAAPDPAWTIEQNDDGCYQLVIPSARKLAAIIDGQHRLFAFAKADPRTRLGMQLICAIFLELPKPFQAQLFATINSTQKPVDRSLTFELFGYNVDDESEPFWTPDKLAVYLARKLGTEPSSPLRGRITIAPKRDPGLQGIGSEQSWRVSTAVVVDGVLRLMSSNPKRDANAMRTPSPRPRAVLTEGAKDKSPMRAIFVEGNDALIYRVVENFLLACEELFWDKAIPGSYILKTVGVQALFDVLRRSVPGLLETKTLRKADFVQLLAKASAINFAESRFQVPAGSGRSLIRRTIEETIVS